MLILVSLSSGDLDLEYSYLDKKLIQFAPLPPIDGSSLVIPCSVINFDPRLNFKSMNVLLKASLSQVLTFRRIAAVAMDSKEKCNGINMFFQILLNAPSDECLQCFPQMSPPKNSVSCVHCGPFGLTRKIWELANRPASSSSQLGSTTAGPADEGRSPITL